MSISVDSRSGAAMFRSAPLITCVRFNPSHDSAHSSWWSGPFNLTLHMLPACFCCFVYLKSQVLCRALGFLVFSVEASGEYDWWGLGYVNETKTLKQAHVLLKKIIDQHGPVNTLHGGRSQGIKGDVENMNNGLTGSIVCQSYQRYFTTAPLSFHLSDMRRISKTGKWENVRVCF